MHRISLYFNTAGLEKPQPKFSVTGKGLQAGWFNQVGGIVISSAVDGYHRPMNLSQLEENYFL